MHWNLFKEKASKISKKFYFKRTHEGYEVWDKAMVYGPGFPRKYRIMFLPFKTNALGFSLSLKKLKHGEWNKRLARQSTVIRDVLKAQELLKQGKKEDFLKLVKEIGKFIRRPAAAVASEYGLTENALRLRMKGVMWDDTKKQLHKIMEARGAFQ